MKRTPRTLAALVAALLFAQWAALAHAADHPTLQTDPACELCSATQGLDLLPGVIAAHDPPRVANDVPAASRRLAAPARRVAGPGIRGPPL